MSELTPENQREADLWAEVFNPHESDRDYFERRKRKLKAMRAGSGTMLTCAGCGGRYEDAPGNFCSFCVT